MQKERYQEMFEYEEKHWWYKGRRKLLLDIVKHLFERKDIDILDVGCGTGYNLISLSDYGNISGLDVSKEAVSFCKKRGLKSISLISLNWKNFPLSKKYHLIICLDVLEHIKNDSKALKIMSSCLMPNGYLLLFVPAFMNLWSLMDNLSFHKRRYAKQELEKKIINCGFKIQMCGYFGFFFYLPLLVLRLFQNTKLGKINSWGVSPKIRHKLIHKIVSPLFYFDTYLSTKISFPFGTSVFILAKKI